MSSHSDMLDQEAGVPADEREEIRGEIEQIVSENKIKVTPQLFDFKPRKKGIGFPLFVNILAAVIVAGGFFYITHLFELRQESLTLEAESFFTAEAQLIQEILAESEQQLRQKDQQLNRIQDQLTELDNEKQQLQQSLEERINQREQELRRQLSRELEEERERLSELGTSESEIENRMKELETEREEMVAFRLEEYRSRIEAELSARRQELNERESELEANLDAVSEERRALEEELARREAELRDELDQERVALQEERAQLEAEAEAARGELTEAEQRLQSLAGRREQELLLTDQILGSYQEFMDLIEIGEYESAGESLDSLQELLQSPALSNYPALARRQEADLRLVRTLRELIGARRQTAGLEKEAGETGPETVDETVEDEGTRRVLYAGDFTGAAEAVRELFEQGRSAEAVERFLEELRAAANQPGIKTLTEDVLSGQREIVRTASALRQNNGSLRENLERATGREEALRARNAALEQELSQLKTRVAELKPYKNRVDELKTAYQADKQEADRMISSDSQVELRSGREVLVSVFSKPEGKALFPGFPVTLDTFNNRIEKLLREQAARSAKSSAFDEVVRLTDYLAGATDAELGTEIEEKAEENPAYREMVQELQNLIRKESESAAEYNAGTTTALSEEKLLGTVSFVQGDALRIERLVPGAVEAGDRIEIKRKNVDGGETLLARGVILGEQDEVLTARIEQWITAGKAPNSRDLVYIEGD